MALIGGIFARRSARGLRRLGAQPAPARRGAAGGRLAHRVGVVRAERVLEGVRELRPRTSPPTSGWPSRSPVSATCEPWRPTRSGPGSLRRVGLPLPPGRGMAFGANRGPAAGRRMKSQAEESAAPRELPVGGTGLELTISACETIGASSSLTSGWLPAVVRLPFQGTPAASWTFTRPRWRALGRKLTGAGSMHSQPNGRHGRAERLNRHQAARALSPRLRGTARHCAFVGRHLVAERLLRFVPRWRRVWGTHGDCWPQTRPTATRTVGSRIGSPV